MSVPGSGHPMSWRPGRAGSRTRRSSSGPSRASTLVSGSATPARSTSPSATHPVSRARCSSRSTRPRARPARTTDRDMEGPTSLVTWVSTFRSIAAGGARPRPPGQPARVSVLMLPARGLVARFVIPCVSSAVHGNVSRPPGVRLVPIAFLLPRSGLRRSLVATGGITSTYRLHPGGKPAKPLRGGSRRARQASDQSPVGLADDPQQGPISSGPNPPTRACLPPAAPPSSPACPPGR